MFDPIARRVWTLERFGLTPRKLVARLRNRNEPRILCVSLPKAGTHLLERALCLHPKLYRKGLPTLHDDNIGQWGGLLSILPRMAPGQLLVSHLHFKPEYRECLSASGVRCIFLIRNPRDILVSQSFYIPAEKHHRFQRVFLAQVDLRARLRLAIAGDPAHGLPSIGQRLADFAGWLDASDIVVRFEDLIGRAGGGDGVTQRATLGSIYGSIGLSLDDRLLDGLGTRLFSKVSPTFRKGTSGQWQQHFDADLATLLRTDAGQQLARYGYGDMVE